MLRNGVALPKQDDVWVSDIQSAVDDYGQPDEHSECLRKVELQHERADTELECRNCTQVEELSEPDKLQILPEVIRSD